MGQRSESITTNSKYKNKKNRLATINVGTLIGRSRELAYVLSRRKIDIACVQETRWKGAKSKNITDSFITAQLQYETELEL